MYLILFFACVAMQIIWLPFYVDFGFMKIPYTPQKMICSTLFIAAGAFAAAYCECPSRYSIFILIAFVLSWAGDLALAKNSRGWRFVCGLSSFLLAHVCFIVSFYYAQKIMFCETKFITKGEIVAIIAVFAVLLMLKAVLKIKFGSLSAPVAVYALAICTMLVKAFYVGIRAVMLGVPHAYPTAAVLMTAAVLFVISDAVLVLILFKDKYSQLTEGVNIVTYYIAQMLFAGSIILVHSGAVAVS